MQGFEYSHRPEEWRLFIDSSKLSLKTVLLHNENILPSIPVGYAAHMKETYENMKNLLQSINYEQHLQTVHKLQTVRNNYAVFCVNGTVVQDINIILKRSGQKEAL